MTCSCDVGKPEPSRADRARELVSGATIRVLRPIGAFVMREEPGHDDDHTHGLRSASQAFVGGLVLAGAGGVAFVAVQVGKLIRGKGGE